jgi:proteasome assembly chaperone (PAC2) family protein
MSMASLEHVRWLAEPALRRPVVLAAFTGWNDAGDVAYRAIRHLVEAWQAAPLAEIDPEIFTDFGTIRPHVRLAGGRTREIVWPTVGLWSVSAPGTDVVLMLGPEPSLRWRLFCDQVLGVADHLGASMFVTLGALLADVPHRRPVQVIGTATEQSLIDRFDLQRSRYEGPTGIVGVLQDAVQRAGLSAVSLWAAVPAYASQEPSPKATLALVERACDLIGTPAPTAALGVEVAEYEHRIDARIEDEDDLRAYVSRLEDMVDAGIDLDEDDDLDEDEEFGDDEAWAGADASSLDDRDEGDTLMEELERFLRDQRSE